MVSRSTEIGRGCDGHSPRTERGLKFPFVLKFGTAQFYFVLKGARTIVRLRKMVKITVTMMCPQEAYRSLLRVIAHEAGRPR
jgi:hypothetical protein